MVWSRLGMNVGGWNSILPGDIEKYRVDTEELRRLGIKKVRLGGGDIGWSNITQFNKELALLYKSYGFYVEVGATKISGTTGPLTASNWQIYHDALLAFAVWCDQNGIDAIMIGNELISHIDNTTLTLTQLYVNLKQLAVDIRAVCSKVKIVYNGTPNEITPLANAGITPGVNIDKAGFNLYGSGPSDTANFQSQVNSVISNFGPKGYISEFNMYYDWSTVPFDQELQQTYTSQRLAILQSSGLDYYFFIWKFHNISDTASWNQYAVKTTTGKPTVTNEIWQCRSFYYTLFPGEYKGNGKRGLAFNGTSTYALTSIVPAQSGISLAFWYSRQRYHTGEEYILGNVKASEGYFNGIRLFHDINSDDLVFNTNDAASHRFNVISSFPVGIWTHIAITMIPGTNTALFYINGEPTGTPVSGDIGTPTNALTLGARAGDNILKGQFFMSDLVIQNTSTPWTQQQIKDLISKNAKPAGATWFDFAHNVNDQSGNGNNLTLTSGSYSVDVPILPDVPIEIPVEYEYINTVLEIK